MSGFGFAFLKALHPEYNRSQIQAQMASQATRPGGAGWDERYGYGVIDLKKIDNAVDFGAWSLQVESPARNSAVTGETPLVVDVNPKLVTKVVVKDENGRAVANLANPRGDYLLRGRFDASLLEPGRHTLTLTAYDSHMGELSSRTLPLSVKKPNTTGLQIKALDPMGRPAKAWIAIFHPALYKFQGQDIYIHEWAWSGETNDAGDLQIANSVLPDGNDFTVYAHIAFAGADGATTYAWYHRTVSVPGRLVLSGANAHPVKLAAKRLQADGSVVPLDDGYILGLLADATGAGIGFPTNVVANLESKDGVTVWMEPGTYNLAATSYQYNHFLYLPQIKVTEHTKRIDFNVDAVAQMTFAGDHDPYLFAGIALYNGSYLEPVFDVTKNHTITFTPGHYVSELISVPLDKGSAYVYFLVDGFDPNIGGLQPGTLYPPGSHRMLHDGTLVEPTMQNYRSYQVPGTDYFSLNKFFTSSQLWLYYGYWFSDASTAALAEALTGGPNVLHLIPGQKPKLVRLGVPGRSSPQPLDVVDEGFGFFEPTFTVTGADGTMIKQDNDLGNLWWSWWRVPTNQGPGLYRAELDLGNIGPLGGPVHTETGVSVRKDGVTSGLRISALGLDGKPTSAWIEVMKKTVLPNGQPFYDWLTWGYTDGNGVMRLQTESYLPDGGEYVVLAFHGSWDSTPPFLLVQDVVSPADIVFDARQAQPVLVKAEDEKGKALGGGVITTTLQDAAGNLIDSFYAAYTPNNGQAKILLTANANYVLSTWNFGRSYFLTSPTMKITSATSEYTFPTNNLARVTVGQQTLPNGQPADWGYFYPNIKGTYIWGVFNPGETITMSAADYELQDLLLTFGLTDLWAYWLDTPSGRLNAGENVTFNFGGPLSASLQTVQTYLDKGEFFSYTDVRDPQRNILIYLLGYSWGSEEAEVFGSNADLSNIDLDKLNRVQFEMKKMQARRQLALTLGPDIAKLSRPMQVQTHYIMTPNLQIFDKNGEQVASVHDADNNWQFLHWAPPAGTGGQFTARMVLPIDSNHDLTADATFRLPGLFVDPGRYSPRKGALKIHLDVPARGTVSVQVQTRDGVPVANVISMQVLAAGGYDMLWNGRQGYRYADDGDYQVVATLEDTGEVLTTPFSLKASIPQRPVIDTPAKYTNVASLRVTGRTSPGSHLEFWIDGRIANLAEPIDANGEGYYAGNVPLGDTDGRHYIKAIAYDDYGNRSSYSGSISTTLDTVAPVISLTRPALTADGSALGTNLDRIAIQGSTEGRSTVILTLTAPDGSVSSRIYRTGYSGSFRDTISLRDIGEYQLRLVATDQAENNSDPVSFAIERNAAP